MESPIEKAVDKLLSSKCCPAERILKRTPDNNYCTNECCLRVLCRLWMAKEYGR